MDTFFQLLQKGVEGLGSKFWSVASAAAALGALSMAVLQMFKDLLPLRRAFQRRRTGKWIDDRSKKAGVEPSKAKSDLIRLATSGDANAFYDLPIEQLCGQMNAALQVALDYPDKYGELLWTVAYMCDPADRHTMQFPNTKLKAALEKKRGEMSEDERKLVDDAAAARNRVAHAVQRAVDGLQISEGFRWKTALQWASVLLSILFAWVAYALAARETSVSIDLGRAIVLGILAGFLAPVSRDLVAGLQQFRKK